MKTAYQLRDQHLWEQAEAALIDSLAAKSTFDLLIMAEKLSREENGICALATFALQFEIHRREQADVS